MATTRDVQALCERVLAALAEPFMVEGIEAVVGASVGVGLMPGRRRRRCSGTSER